jgi:hypothetical protein
MIEEYQNDAKRIVKGTTDTPIPPTIQNDSRTSRELLTDKQSAKQKINDFLVSKGLRPE